MLTTRLTQAASGNLVVDRTCPWMRVVRTAQSVMGASQLICWTAHYRMSRGRRRLRLALFSSWRLTVQE